MIALFCHDDMDGQCSGAIAYRELGKQEGVNEIIIYCIDYGDKLPTFKPEDNVKAVYIMDFSFEPEYMDYLILLVGRDNVIWIDHHISAIRKLDTYKDLNGIRSIIMSGCALTYRYFYPDKFVPMVVALVEDFDLYNYKYGDLTKGFQEWSNYNDTEPVGIIWDTLLTSNFDQLEELSQDGLRFREIRLWKLEKDIERLAYVDELDGHKCLKMNLTQEDSISDAGDFVINKLEYDLFWAYSDIVINGKLQRTNQLRSHVIDVSKLADKFGGGGHERAAGFLSDIGERNGEC